MKLWLAPLAAALVVAGCNTSGQQAAAPAAGATRASAETAPADLQLLCASEAATRFGVPSDRVLPTASAATSANVYQVQLMVDGTPAACQVDSNGTIISLA